MNRTSASDLAPQLSQETRHSLAELGNDFLREFLEVEISRHPDTLEALAELCQIYTQLGLWSIVGSSPWYPTTPPPTTTWAVPRLCSDRRTPRWSPSSERWTSGTTTPSS